MNIYVDDETYHSFPHFIGKSAWYRSLAHFVGKAAWDLSFSKPDKATLGSHSSVELVLVVYLDQKIFTCITFIPKNCTSSIYSASIFARIKFALLDLGPPVRIFLNEGNCIHILTSTI